MLQREHFQENLFLVVPGVHQSFQKHKTILHAVCQTAMAFSSSLIIRRAFSQTAGIQTWEEIHHNTPWDITETYSGIHANLRNSQNRLHLMCSQEAASSLLFSRSSGRKTDCQLLNVTTFGQTLFLANLWVYHKPPTEQHDLRTQVILRDTQIGAEPSFLPFPTFTYNLHPSSIPLSCINRTMCLSINNC